MRWLNGTTESMDMSLSKLQEKVKPGMLQFIGSQRLGHELANEQQQQLKKKKKKLHTVGNKIMSIIDKIFYWVQSLHHHSHILNIEERHMWKLGLILELERSPGGGHGNSLQYYCLENPHGQRSLAGYSAWGCRVGHNWATKHSAQVKTDEFF